MARSTSPARFVPFEGASARGRRLMVRPLRSTTSATAQGNARAFCAGRSARHGRRDEGLHPRRRLRCVALARGFVRKNDLGALALQPPRGRGVPRIHAGRARRFGRRAGGAPLVLRRGGRCRAVPRRAPPSESEWEVVAARSPLRGHSPTTKQVPATLAAPAPSGEGGEVAQPPFRRCVGSGRDRATNRVPGFAAPKGRWAWSNGKFHGRPARAPGRRA